jgi:hypothetical protein
MRYKNSTFREIMENLGVSDEDLDTVWSLLDADHNGEVDEHEFLDMMWRFMSDDSSKWTILQMWSGVEHLCRKLNRVEHKVEEQSKRIERVEGSFDVKVEQIAIAVAKHINSMTPDKESEGSDAETRTPRPRFPSKKILTKEGLCGSDSSSHVNQDDLDDGRIKCRASDKSTTLASLQNISAMKHPLGKSDELALQYMKGIHAEKLATFGRADTIEFWCSGQLLPGPSFEAMACQRCDYFVSHCWLPPTEWDDHFLRGNSTAVSNTYEYKKAQQLNNTMQLIRKQRIQRGENDDSFKWENFVCWVDKACIPQADKEARQNCILLIEDFVKLCDGLIVMLSWNYFTRLWCVYEWACFLVVHHPLRVEIGLDAFLKYKSDETLPLFIQSIEEISVQRAMCHNEDDRAILEEKVFQYYCGSARADSFSAFERFAKFTALSLIAKEIIMWRARADEESELDWMKPLRDSAARLGFDKLHKALEIARPAEWYKEAHGDFSVFQNVVSGWIGKVIVPLLLHERAVAVRRSTAGKMMNDPTKSSALGTVDVKNTPTGHETVKNQNSSSFNPYNFAGGKAKDKEKTNRRRTYGTIVSKFAHLWRGRKKSLFHKGKQNSGNTGSSATTGSSSSDAPVEAHRSRDSADSEVKKEGSHSGPERSNSEELLS